MTLIVRTAAAARASTVAQAMRDRLLGAMSRAQYAEAEEGKQGWKGYASRVTLSYVLCFRFKLHCARAFAALPTVGYSGYAFAPPLRRQMSITNAEATSSHTGSGASTAPASGTVCA